MARRLHIMMCLAVLAAGVGVAAAQEAPAAPGNSSMPTMGDVLDAVEKASAPGPGTEGKDWSAPVKLAVVFAGLAVLPSVLVMMTSFTRIVIVLSFIRRALTTQSVPPTIAIVGLALFLTLFTMAPTFEKINAEVVKPYLAEQVTFEAAASQANLLLKEFMVRHTRQSDLALFVDMAKMEPPTTVAQVPSHVAIPAFAISEFRTAFEMGCLIFIPFLVVDLVTAGILLSAGMMMLPPVIVSMPFKIILFVLVDGWQLVAKALVTSYQAGG